MLAALAICPDRPVDENALSATAAARLELALAYINNHFDTPSLTIASVARDQNACGPETGSYCKARQRLPLKVVTDLARGTAEQLDEQIELDKTGRVTFLQLIPLQGG